MLPMGIKNKIENWLFLDHHLPQCWEIKILIPWLQEIIFRLRIEKKLIITVRLVLRHLTPFFQTIINRIICRCLIWVMVGRIWILLMFSINSKV